MQPNSANTYTGRWVAGASVLLGLVGAVLPAVAGMDTSSTAGIVAGLIAICTVAIKYLDGVQRYEERLDAVTPTATPAPPITGDEPEPETDEPPASQPGEVVDLPTLFADVPGAPTDDEIDAATPEAIAADVVEEELAA
jgi:hypothetical protein